MMCHLTALLQRHHLTTLPSHSISPVVIHGHRQLGISEPLTRRKAGTCVTQMLVMQVFEEVALWPHPDSGSRLIVNIGGLARPFQVTALHCHWLACEPSELLFELSMHTQIGDEPCTN